MECFEDSEKKSHNQGDIVGFNQDESQPRATPNYKGKFCHVSGFNFSFKIEQPSF